MDWKIKGQKQSHTRRQVEGEPEELAQGYAE
jgi:hypothetical protein